MVGYEYCTGRVDAYVSDTFAATVRRQGVAYPGAGILSQSYTALLLGTCEQYPLVKAGQNNNPWFADQTGCMEPADWENEGEWRVIALDLNKFSQTSHNFVSSFGSTTSNGLSGLGKLVQANGTFFSLWLRFANYYQPGGPPIPDLPPGEFYPCCRLVENSYSQLGTRNRTSPLVIRTIPLLTLSDNSTLTYSIDPKWFTNLPAPDDPHS